MHANQESVRIVVKPFPILALFCPNYEQIKVLQTTTTTNNNNLFICSALFNMLVDQKRITTINNLKTIKVIPEFCIAHSYCARILRHQRAHMSERAHKHKRFPSN